MSLWQNYLRPKDLPQALEMLRLGGGRARVVAGGTDLLLDLMQGRQAPVDSLVDVSAIPDLGEIRIGPEEVFIGAAVPLRRIVEDPSLRAETPAVVEACLLIGGPQVRVVATLGGNVAHALPAGDGTIALLAHDARAGLAGPRGERWLPLVDLFAGPGRPAFDPSSEILIGFRMSRLRSGETSAFERVMRPQGVAIAILNLAVWIRISPAGIVEDVRLAVGPAGPRPLRAVGAEDSLRRRPVDEASLVEAARALRGEATLRTSRYRATADYRDHLVEVLLRRTLRKALQRLAGAAHEAPRS